MNDSKRYFLQLTLNQVTQILTKIPKCRCLFGFKILERLLELRERIRSNEN